MAIELRWLITERKVTATQVRAFAAQEDIPLMNARTVLAQRSAPTLQFRTGSLGNWGPWTNVPTVVLEPDHD